jgi:hypothetical protein
MIRSLARNNSVKLVDQYSAILPTWSTSNIDGLHLNDNGYQTLAETWYDALASNDLRDTIFMMLTLAGKTDEFMNSFVIDINDDGRLGMAEILCRLKNMAEIR